MEYFDVKNLVDSGIYSTKKVMLFRNKKFVLDKMFQENLQNMS